MPVAAWGCAVLQAADATLCGIEYVVTHQCSGSSVGDIDSKDDITTQLLKQQAMGDMVLNNGTDNPTLVRPCSPSRENSQRRQANECSSQSIAVFECTAAVDRSIDSAKV